MNSRLPSEDYPSTPVPSSWAATSPSRLDEPIAPRRVPPAHHPRRRPQAQALTPQAHVWLARLPPHFQPMATARRYPHIVNRLAELWATPKETLEHLRELMLSSRPGRREGFPFEVLSELADLQAMVEEMPPGRR